jgi:ABC-type taurine transport system ATPase subunit
MHKALIFVAGSVAGAVALPATLIYVKPVRTKIVDAALNKAKKYVAAKIVDDAEFRTELIDVGSEVLAGLIIIEESKKGR